MPRWCSIARSMAIARAAACEFCSARGLPALRAAAVDDSVVGPGHSRRVCKHAVAAQAARGAARPARWLHRTVPAKAWRIECCVHRAHCGGARIDWLRMMVCTMSSARPQC